MNFDDYRGIWVFIEVKDGRIAPVSLELLGAGRLLADKRRTELAGVIIGEGIKPLADTAFAYGADTLYVYDAPIYKHYRTETYMKALLACTEKYKPEIILYGATSTGKDLASAVATDLPTGLTADTTILDVEEDTGLLLASRPAFGGNIMATILCKKYRPQMATVRPKVMKALSPEAGRTGRLIEESIPLQEEDVRTKVLDIVRATTAKVRIDEADVIVAGGKGMGSPAGFQLIHQLAGVLGAAVGASRDVVEAGWIEHHHQVGQTGLTVTPKVYFAIGISGAIQHIVGMQNAGLIIAINKDPNAAIFQSCHYGIVGDAFEIVPLLIGQFQAALEPGSDAEGEFDSDSEAESATGAEAADGSGAADTASSVQGSTAAAESGAAEGADTVGGNGDTVEGGATAVRSETTGADAVSTNGALSEADVLREAEPKVNTAATAEGKPPDPGAGSGDAPAAGAPDEPRSKSDALGGKEDTHVRKI